VKPSEKYKFVFEWDKSEDTSADLNPLYVDRIEARPQFGRGYLGGIDKREQLKRYQHIVKETKKDMATADPKLDLVERQRINYDSQLTELDKAESAGLHWTQKKLTAMTSRDWRIFKEDHNITTKGGALPNPIRSWTESGLSPWLLSAVAEAGYTKPTPVQMQAIPLGLAGRDILGVAETGSGKTCAFVLPMLTYISGLPKMTKDIEADGPYALILAPTRELASQIADEAEKFAKWNGYRVVLLVGGVPIEEQAIKLRKGCEIIVATPGRLNDCIENHYVVLNQCNYVVLDEADRMVDMGFEPQVISVLDSMPKDTLKSELEEEAALQELNHRNKYRTTLMFSATMPPEVERLSRRYLRRPGVIYIGEAGKAVSLIHQDVYWLHNETDKRRKLEALLRDGPAPPIIIFVNQRKQCDTLAKFLGKMNYKCTTLQGGRSQEQRDWALLEFKEGRSDILVATDVAGRGLDVKGVTHVINFDMPKTIEQYTHRIGRTGRAGAAGLASSFLTNEDYEIMFHLKKMLMETGAHVPQELRDHLDV